MRHYVSTLVPGVSGRGLLVSVFMLAGLSLGTLLPLLAGSVSTREVVLVARDMSFYLDGDAQPNPTLRLKAGERVRLVLRNRDAGVTHDFVVKRLQLAIQPLRGEGVGSVEFRAPSRPGRYPYLCTPHARMMYGTLAVE